MMLVDEKNNLEVIAVSRNPGEPITVHFAKNDYVVLRWKYSDFIKFWDDVKHEVEMAKSKLDAFLKEQHG